VPGPLSFDPIGEAGRQWRERWGGETVAPMMAVTSVMRITFTLLFGRNRRLSTELASILQPDQWLHLISRIGQIAEPSVPLAISKYAIRNPVGG
jgi:hypothetical protein